MKKILLFIVAFFVLNANSQTLIKLNQIVPFEYNYNRNYLKDWDAKISNIQRATASSTASVIWIGDSWTMGQTFAQPIASYLRYKFGDAGCGYYGASTLNVGSTNSTFGQSITRVIVGSWVEKSGTTYVRSAGLAIDSSSTVNDSIYYVGVMTDVAVHYMLKSSGGSFVTRIDGTSPTTVSTSGATSWSVSTITGITEGTHTISIKVASAGSGVLISGAEINRNTNGVRIHNLGSSGSSSLSWLNQDSTSFALILQRLNPNMAIITLGVNDCAQNFLVANYIGNITRIVNRIKAAMPNCDIVLFSQSDIGNSYTYAWSSYLTAAKNYALANNYVYIDNYALIGSYTTANARGLYANTLHPNNVGGNVMVNSFLDYLMNGLKMYYSNGNNFNMGESSLLSVTSGSLNTAIGSFALQAATSGTGNVGVGYNSLLLNTSASNNSALGYGTGRAITTGRDNCAFGTSALFSTTTGSANCAFGSGAVFTNTSAAGNCGFGYSALNATRGSNSCAFGYSCLDQASTGTQNTAMGFAAGHGVTTGASMVCIGALAGYYGNLNRRVFINSIDRTTAAKDSTDSPIYVYEHATVASQRIYLNGVTYCSNGIKGTATNDNATAGNVGETNQVLVATGAAVTMTTATAANVCTLSLAAGDYLVTGQVTYKETTATVTGRQAGINSTSATIPTDGTESFNDANTVTLSETNTLPCSGKRISLSATTTIYLVAKPTFAAGTVTAYGFINATRIR